MKLTNDMNTAIVQKRPSLTVYLLMILSGTLEVVDDILFKPFRPIVLELLLSGVRLAMASSRVVFNSTLEACNSAILSSALNSCSFKSDTSLVIRNFSDSASPSEWPDLQPQTLEQPGVVH